MFFQIRFAILEQDDLTLNFGIDYSKPDSFLVQGKQTRNKLLSGLIKMYQDQKVDQYYDSSHLGNYNIRYNLFLLVVVFTGIIAIIIPFIVR